MKIIKERTRLIFTEYTDAEKRKIENLVGTMNKVFTYEDPDNHIIAFPPGMEKPVNAAFPKIPIEDHSKEYWPYAYITPVEHNAQPRNQLQIDFIKFVLNCANKKQKLAGILSPGTGKAQPLSTKIPTPDGYKLMGEIHKGDIVFGSNGDPITVTDIFPQGKKDVYEITFNDGRTSRCCKEHLWTVLDTETNELKTMTLEDIMNGDTHYAVPELSFPVHYRERSVDTTAFEFGDHLEYNIPEDYMYNTIYDRMELLRGILHKNGYISFEHGLTINYENNHILLLEQIRQVVLSLGIKCNIDNNILKINAPTEFIEYVFMCIRRIDEYKLPWGYTYENQYLGIDSIKLIGEEECQCIMVNSEDHLYVTEDFIVTHNTFMACYSAIKVGLRTLIIVPTSGIKVQWAETLTNMFNVDPSKVKVVTSPNDFINVKADFVITSQASLAILNKKYNLEQIMKDNKFGIKVIDEVQMWFHNIIKIDGNSNICHNWYLTGTFGRSDQEENDLYQQMFGDLAMFREKEKNPTIFNRKPGNVYGMKPHMHVKMVWTKSGLSNKEINEVTNSMRYSERTGKLMMYGISIPAYTNLVIPPDGTMTKHLSHILKVIEMAEKEVKYGKMLILDSTISAVEVIYKYVVDMFPNKKVGTIHSHNSKHENDRVKAECDILISTVKSCGTGFDVKDLSKLVVSAAFSSWILTDQVSGRLRRRPDGKDTYMWDIVDAQIPQLRAWANNRADVLRRKSKTFKVVDM